MFRPNLILNPYQKCLQLWISEFIVMLHLKTSFNEFSISYPMWTQQFSTLQMMFEADNELIGRFHRWHLKWNLKNKSDTIIEVWELKIQEGGSGCILQKTYESMLENSKVKIPYFRVLLHFYQQVFWKFSWLGSCFIPPPPTYINTLLTCVHLWTRSNSQARNCQSNNWDK